MMKMDEKYQAMIEGIEEGCYQVDIAGNFTFFNNSMCRMLGYSRSEMIGMNNRAYMDTENAERVYRAFNKTYKTGRPNKGFDFVIERRDDWVFLLLQGQVKVKRSTPRGMVTIDTLKEGAVFGEMEFFEKGETARCTSVIADGPVLVGLLDSQQLVGEYGSISPEIKELFRALIRRLKDTTGKVVGLYMNSK